MSYKEESFEILKKNKIIVGYKGESTMEPRIVWAPYVPINSILLGGVENLPDYDRCMKALYDREKEEKLKEILK